MLVLHGKTGGGKSEAVTKLLQPLDDLVDYSGRPLAVCRRPAALPRLRVPRDVLGRDGQGRQSFDVGVLKNIITARNVGRGGRPGTIARSRSAAARLLHRHHEPGPARTHIRPDEHERRFYRLECQDHIDWEISQRALTTRSCGRAWMRARNRPSKRDIWSGAEGSSGGTSGQGFARTVAGRTHSSSRPASSDGARPQNSMRTTRSSWSYGDTQALRHFTHQMFGRKLREASRPSLRPRSWVQGF